MPSDVLFQNTVTVNATTWPNVDGERTASTASTVRVASVQAKSARLASAYGLEAGARPVEIFFPAPDPDVHAGDTITWDGQAYAVLGRARNTAGLGMVFVVDCKEIA